jgi:(1->4)-alpha-D-glucan 1-alpha-D-glucosylmutase
MPPSDASPARIPASTYRLQLNASFTFADAAAIVPYLDRLGVAAVYCSPYLQAHPGSTHGYDVTDHNRLSADLGGEAAYRTLADVLAVRGMGQLLDFVPNHMGLADARANGWWWDVVENGPCSPYARFFDVDWDPVKTELAGKVLLPTLGDQYGRVLERGELQLTLVDGAMCLRYFDHELPINPRRVPLVLRRGLEALHAALGETDPDMRELLSILTALDHLPTILETDPQRITERQREKEVARERLARLMAHSAIIRRHVEACVHATNGTVGQPESFDALHAILEAQAYRLAYWRTAFHEINYRRFFDINTLVSIRMEEPEVFEAAHRLILRLIGEGSLTGLRLDHLDGLFDPGDYLQRLEHAAQQARTPAGESPGTGLPVYVVAEKILSPGEALPPSWRLHGTSGYDFLNDLNGVFVDARGHKTMLRIYERFTGRREPLDDVVYESKKVVMESTLASELNILTHALNRISEGDRRSRDFTLNSLREMLLEIVACFPVYRTYVTPEGHGDADARVVEAAVGRARRRNPGMDASIFEFFKDVVLDRAPADVTEEERRHRRTFAVKFQQYTGPVQAKGLEDTAFYRYNVLLSLNEVGGAPHRFGRTAASFHKSNRARHEHWPYGMLCTATHDTKRGEDARARLNVLSEVADDWGREVARWARINAPNRTVVDEAPAPDRNDEYLFYQALVGVWPTADAEPAALIPRLHAYMQKAIREAKIHTSWINEYEAYETAVADFVTRTLTGPRTRKFLEYFVPFQRRVARLGMVNSLAQVTLKLLAPGVPDFYQGTELWDLSLVDPDNRRPVDFAARERMLAALAPLCDARLAPAERAARVQAMVEDWEDGAIKLYLTASGLRLRREVPAVFLDGEYLPLDADGERAEHVVAAARRQGDEVVLGVVPRLSARLADGGPPVGPAVWGSTRLPLPPVLADRRWLDQLTGASLAPITIDGSPGLSVAEVLAACPVALLRTAPPDGAGPAPATREAGPGGER